MILRSTLSTGHNAERPAGTGRSDVSTKLVLGAIREGVLAAPFSHKASRTASRRFV